MRQDEILDDLNWRMSGDDFSRYLEIRERFSDHAEAMRDLEAELEALVVKYGLLADGQGDALNPADQIRFNTWWAKTTAGWQCPCCNRGKPQILRRDRSGRLFGNLTAHHDHFRELLDNIEAERAKVVAVTSPLDASSKRFVRRFTEGLSRFDDVVICEDCNTADAAAKKIVYAPPHFTFTPTEIAGFITVTPNQVHGIDEANLRFIYAIALPQFETRKRSADHLADRVLGGTHWHEHVEWSDRPESIDRAVEAMMRVLGFRDAAHWSVAERLLLPPSGQKADHTRWRTRERTAATKPTANEAEYIVRCHARHWDSVPEHWRCPACNRPKYDIIRPTKQFKWMFVLDEARFAAIDAPLGEAKVVICDACRQAMKDFNQEARHDPKIGAWSAPYLSLADLRQMVRPQAHGLHNIDNVAANMLLTALQRASEGGGSDDYC